MPTSTRAPYSRPVVVVAALALFSAAAAAQERPAREPDVVRVFRFHAGAEAEALRDAAGRAKVDEALRKELLDLIRDHLGRVDAEAKRVAATKELSLDEVLRRAAALAKDFNEVTVARWLEEHPSAFEPVQEQVSLAEAYSRALTVGSGAVLDAAKKAGLPADKQAEAGRVVADAERRLRRLRQDTERQLATTRPASPAADKGPVAKPSEAQPPDPDDLIAGADFQTSAVAAAREVRDAVEKMLPEARQREAMSGEMLRWLQSVQPDGEEADPGPPPRDPKAAEKPSR